ncbi:conserved hypothetical protein [Methylocella tundrae]|uniref:Flagellar protein FlgN n=1 Tax=Methylocella tundrae TaxID=227605 RepID=A0A8B6M4X7_METTU|nr:hypothetical protein [Methylocella tundrae]VTZ23990.1 conserved hypothetical protein [Methylocella tundrae]VTZ50061.1 conserved hypothetical protein [Methylocella tundrae]
MSLTDGRLATELMHEPGAVGRLSPPTSPGGPATQREDPDAAERSTLPEGEKSRPMLETFFNAVEKLESLLDLETQLLRQNKPVALHDFNHKKSYGLLELSRAMSACRAHDRSAFDFEARAPLGRLRTKLESNLASLQTHLTAVGEIAAIIARAIQDHESDGTYSIRRYTRSDRE